MNELEAAQHIYHKTNQMNHHHYDVGDAMTCRPRGTLPPTQKDLYWEWFDASLLTLMPQDKIITDDLSVHNLHEKLQIGVDNIETILVYRQIPGHPDPGEHLMIKYYKVRDLYYQINFQKEMHDRWMLA